MLRYQSIYGSQTMEDDSSEDRKKNKKEGIPSGIRQLVWFYDNGCEYYGVCYICLRIIEITNFDCSHIEAEVLGGDGSITNLHTLCRSCNLGQKITEMYKYIKKKGTWNFLLTKEEICLISADKITGKMEDKLIAYKDMIVGYAKKRAEEDRKIQIANLRRLRDIKREEEAKERENRTEDNKKEDKKDEAKEVKPTKKETKEDDIDIESDDDNDKTDEINVDINIRINDTTRWNRPVMDAIKRIVDENGTKNFTLQDLYDIIHIIEDEVGSVCQTLKSLKSTLRKILCRLKERGYIRSREDLGKAHYEFVRDL